MILRTYTPPQVGILLQMKPESVIAAIRRGELVAINVAQPGTKRPRYRITDEALQAFLRARTVGVAPAQQAPRRRKSPTIPRYV